MGDGAPGADLTGARDAYHRRDWVSAWHGFTTARARRELDADDLGALADAAWWLGRTDECLELYAQVHLRHERARRAPQAARLALDIGFLNYLRGDVAAGSGWISRARRLLRDLPECVEHSYLRNLDVNEALAAGDYPAALRLARDVQAIGHRFGHPTATALGLVGEGVALVRQGRVADGLAALDEAMLPVVAGEVEPAMAGQIYCQLMQLCHELADLRRARQWTDATERWCAGFPSAVMFAGICRVHRVQLLHMQGEWDRAEREAARVCRELATMNVAVVAEGHYQAGEVRRLRDDLPGAEAAYQRAHQLGRDPQPGLALLRLAQGRLDAAVASIRAALAADSTDRLARAKLRAAQVEIALAAADPGTATMAADDLDDIAGTYRSPGLTASASQARGTAELAREQPGEALPPLREACRRWHDLDAPYPAARVRLLLARAYAALGDADAAGRELDTAAATFDALGASADTRTVTALRRDRPPAGLSPREAQVLALVAAGRSNRAIAAALVISDKTVARHLSNIFTKIKVSSRTEAAAYAFRSGLARPDQH